MNCPTCNHALTPRDHSGVRVDECPKCNGVWFDREELRRSKDLADPDLKWMDVDLWSDASKFQADAGKRVCPKCHTGMSLLNYPGTEITVDCCPGCSGVWLERGEFERIIEALEKSLLSKSVGDYVSAALSEARELVTGKESFVSEWKDFTTVLRLLEYRVLAHNPALHSAITAAQRTNPLS